MDMARQINRLSNYLSTMKKRRAERCEERLEEDNMENMIRDVGTKAFARAHVCETMSAGVVRRFN